MANISTNNKTINSMQNNVEKLTLEDATGETNAVNKGRSLVSHLW